MGIIEELKWRGMIQDIMPGTEEYLSENQAVGYAGFDPTSHSLGIGNLVPVTLLALFQKHGHQPIALVGGATGMVGDPSGKSQERNLLDVETLQRNVAGQTAQLRKFLDFDREDNPAILVNNYDWFGQMNLLEFLRDVGKHLTVAYMLSKDSVQSRLEKGISFTEFSYQLIQGFDFLHLYREHNCMVQMGGSDQWGNITSGTELIRRMDDGKAYAFTCPLITKADGTKFGKTEKGNIFLDPELTSPFSFYQYFIGLADEDAKKLLRVFSLKEVEEIQETLDRHDTEGGGNRVAQHALAEELTRRVHGQEELDRAIQSSKQLFSSSASDNLADMDDEQLKNLLSGVPSGTVDRDQLKEGMGILDFLNASGAFASNGEARRALTKDQSVQFNNEKVTDPQRIVTLDDLVKDRFILVNKSKKKRYVVYCE